MDNTQKPSGMPIHKYRPYHEQIAVQLPDRTWPDARITKAPRWCAVDLRDGNQALIDPMSPERKRIMFDLLVSMGYKEIEVGFPSASQTDFDFVRHLIEEDVIPDDVTIQVLTQAREHLIERTYESIAGAKQAIVHLYNSTSVLQREVVFRTDKQGIIDIALEGARLCREFEKRIPETKVYYEYSPESYTGTELEFAVDVCNQVIEIFEPTPDRKVIINLPATVEMATPNVYADSIEWMSRQPRPPRERDPVAAPAQRPGHRDRRGRARLHGRRRPHRGMPLRQRRAHRQRRPRRAGHQPADAGHRSADRLQRRRPGQAHRGVLQPAARSTSAARGPATSSSRPSAARTRTPSRRASRRWTPAPRPKASRSTSSNGPCPTCRSTRRISGRSYEAVIRVNSQSGKGGVAYLLKTDHALDLPRRLQIEFSGVVQAKTDAEGGEVTSDQIWAIFTDEYLPVGGRRRALGSLRAASRRARRATCPATSRSRSRCATATSASRPSGHGNGPVAAFLEVVREHGFDVSLYDYVEHALSAGGDAQAAAYVELQVDGERLWGVGIDGDISTASLKAIVSCVNRAIRTREPRAELASV